MAIRMSQALRPVSDLYRDSSSADRPGNNESESTVIQQEMHHRTIWSCFTMDRLLSCGKDRPAIFVAEDMRIPLPLDEADYAFGKIKGKRRYLQSSISSWRLGLSEPDQPWTIDSYLAIILQGVDIWATVSHWTAEGGRRKHHGVDDCPWKETSAWNKISCDVEGWFNQLDERVRYSPARLAAQSHQGHPEAFAFINLLYFIW
jgi:hypothetical protein